MKLPLALSLLSPSAFRNEILYDGRAKPSFDAGTVDNSSGPYLAYAIPLFGSAPAERFSA